MSMMKSVRAVSMVYRNTNGRMETSSMVNARTGHFIGSLAPTRLAPGTVFDVDEAEYDTLIAAGAIVDVDPEAAADDLIG